MSPRDTLATLVLLTCAAAASCGRVLPSPGDGFAPSVGPGELELELSFEDAEIAELYEVRPRARLVNRGERTILVVRPGDGSDCGWRTPIVSWHATTAAGEALQVQTGFGGCGNRNAIRADELVELAPGEAVLLDEWLGYPPLPGPGEYAVALEYWNDPGREWQGLASDEPGLLARARGSTACRVRSAPAALTWRR